MELLDLEREASRDSTIHRIDSKIKVISFLLLVFSAVFIGRSISSDFLSRIISLAVLEAYLLVIVSLARLDKSLFLKRVLMILPFGGTVAVLKPFVEEGVPIYTFPLGITVTYEGISEAILLLFIMVVSISSIVVLSSTTTIQGLINSMKKIGFPKELALLFGMTLRYIFLYGETLQKILDAQRSRCFSIRNRRVKLRYILEQLGYTVMMLFIRSYEHGLKIYQSMISRCYTSDSTLLLSQRGVTSKDILFAIVNISVIGSAIYISSYGIPP
jgi:cobalt/nickel transport system permease protein